jgi:hypothetical protein
MGGNPETSTRRTAARITVSAHPGAPASSPIRLIATIIRIGVSPADWGTVTLPRQLIHMAAF